MKRIIFLGFSTVLTLLLFSCSKEKERIYEPRHILDIHP